MKIQFAPNVRWITNLQAIRNFVSKRKHTLIV